MDKRTKIFIGLSIGITVFSVLLGASVFYRSYMRLWETLGDLWDSVRYYFCEIFMIKHNIHAGVTDKSEVLGIENILPETEDGFGVKWAVYFRLFFYGGNIQGYGEKGRNGHHFGG